MWQKFTERSRRAIYFARAKARQMGHFEVMPEYLCWGLAHHADNTASRTLSRLHVSPELVAQEIERKLVQGHGRGDRNMTLSTDVYRIVDLAYDEARHLKNGYIGTEHLLLALIRDQSGLSAHILQKLGVELQAARAVVKEIHATESLLRPSASPEVASEVLVRPARGVTAPNPEQLLKPAGTQPAEPPPFLNGEA